LEVTGTVAARNHTGYKGGDTAALFERLSTSRSDWDKARADAELVASEDVRGAMDAVSDKVSKRIVVNWTTLLTPDAPSEAAPSTDLESGELVQQMLALISALEEQAADSSAIATGLLNAIRSDLTADSQLVGLRDD